MEVRRSATEAFFVSCSACVLANAAGGSSLLAAAASHAGCCTGVGRRSGSSREQQQPSSCIVYRQVILITAIPRCLLSWHPSVRPDSCRVADRYQLRLRRPLWEPQVLLAEARERVAWHEAMDSGAAPSDRQQVGAHRPQHQRSTLGWTKLLPTILQQEDLKTVVFISAFKAQWRQ